MQNSKNGVKSPSIPPTHYVEMDHVETNQSGINREQGKGFQQKPDPKINQEQEVLEKLPNSEPVRKLITYVVLTNSDILMKLI